MRAKFILEAFSEESDPIHDMDIGMKDYELPLKQRRSPKFKNQRGGTSYSRGYLIWRVLDYISEQEDDGGARYKDIVQKYYELGGDQGNRKTLGMGAWNTLKEYTFTSGPSPLKPYTGKGLLRDRDEVYYPSPHIMGSPHTASRKRKTRYFVNVYGYRFLEKYRPYFEKGVQESLTEKFYEDTDPIKDMGIGYGRKGNTTAFKILLFLQGKGKEGATVKEIQHHLLVTLGDMSEEEFREKRFGGRKTRGYWVGGLYGSSGPKLRVEGLLYKWCEKDPKTKKWVLKSFPKPGDNMFDTTKGWR